MGTIVRLKAGTGDFHLDHRRKLVKAETYLALLDADRTRTEAREEAEALRRAAQEAYEQQKRQGYEDGMAQAREEQAESLFLNAERTVSYLNNLEHDLAAVVVDAVRKIIGEFDDRTLTMAIVTKALETVRNQAKVTLRVPPEAADDLRARIRTLETAFPDIGFIEVVADRQLKPGSCLLASDIGIVDASIEGQVAALERSLRRRIDAGSEHGH